jgi:transcriptional regulator with XRE-family HTH domain
LRTGLTLQAWPVTLSRMTTTPGERTATLSLRVAEEIRAWLGRRRMSQAQLARALGQSPMWVSDRLRGIQPIDLDAMERIARVLDIPVIELFPAPSRGTGSSGKINNLNDNLAQIPRSAHVPTVTGTPFPRSASRPSGQPRKAVTRPGSPMTPTRRRPVPVASPVLPMSA